MGAAIGYARSAQVPLAIAHVKIARDVLTAFSFVEQRGHTAVTREADRCLRADHAVELAALPDHRQGVAGARGRLHGRA